MTSRWRLELDEPSHYTKTTAEIQTDRVRKAKVVTVRRSSELKWDRRSSSLVRLQGRDRRRARPKSLCVLLCVLSQCDALRRAVVCQIERLKNRLSVNGLIVAVWTGLRGWKSRNG